MLSDKCSRICVPEVHRLLSLAVLEMLLEKQATRSNYSELNLSLGAFFLKSEKKKHSGKIKKIPLSHSLRSAETDERKARHHTSFQGHLWTISFLIWERCWDRNYHAVG